MSATGGPSSSMSAHAPCTQGRPCQCIVVRDDIRGAPSSDVRTHALHTGTADVNALLYGRLPLLCGEGCAGWAVLPPGVSACL
jgi:hypothetical protein